MAAFSRRHGGAVAIATTLLVFGGAARAAPTAQERALAETLFREGRSLVAAGNIEVACPKFAESQRLDPTLGTLMHLATCHEQQGKTATAWAEFADAARLARKLRQNEREQQALKAAKALEAKLSRVVVVAADASVAVSIDGTPLGAGSFGVPLPFDPGKHSLVASAPGKATHTSEFVVEPGASVQTIEVPGLTNEPAPPPVADASPPPPDRAPSRAPETGSGDGQRTLGLVVGGVGIVACGAGAFFGLRASAQASDADKLCQGRFCSAAGLAGHDDANTSALISTVAFVAGGAAIATGLALFFSAPKSTTTARMDAPRRRWSLSPAAAGARLDVVW